MCKVFCVVFVFARSMSFMTQARIKFHVLLTTYEMIQQDASPLRSIDFEVLIVDEGHRYIGSIAVLIGTCNKGFMCMQTPVSCA